MAQMKHIKTFNEIVVIKSVSDDMIEDIKDICQELKDDGFYVNVYQLDQCVLITKRKLLNNGSSYHLVEFNYNDVSEVIERLKDYIGNRFLKTQAQMYMDHWYEIDRKGDETPINFKDVKGVKIYYTR